MGEYNICTDYLEIVSGTSNKASTVYREAANNVATDNEKSMKYLQNFLTSIETMAASSKTKDPTITASAGNIKECKSYENIKYALDFLNKNLSNLPMLKDLNTIYRSLESYQPQYTDGYRKKSRLVILEYENTVYMLIEGLAATMCTGIDYEHTGTKIKIKRKSGSTHEVINRLVTNLAKELSKKDHKTYLESLIKASDEKPISKVENEKKSENDTPKPNDETESLKESAEASSKIDFEKLPKELKDTIKSTHDDIMDIIKKKAEKIKDSSKFTNVYDGLIALMEKNFGNSEMHGEKLWTYVIPDVFDEFFKSFKPSDDMTVDQCKTAASVTINKLLSIDYKFFKEWESKNKGMHMGIFEAIPSDDSKDYPRDTIIIMYDKDLQKKILNTEDEGSKNIKESVEAFTEGNVRDIMDVAGVLFNAGKNVTKFGVNAVKAIKNSLFGIIPLIRSIMYLRYKRKADKITSLDQQVQFIQQNIEQLRNREGDMDPKKKEQIIKRQEAIIEAHKKKAEKLRAQLMEEEKEASNALKQDDPSMGKTNDEFVLEGCTLMEIFNEENLSNFF